MSEEPRTAGDAPLPGGNFRLLIQKMGYQALISLGAVENPLTGKRNPNLPGAHAVLEDLRMLAEKTRGNLEPDENEHLEKVISDLGQAFERMAGASTSDEA